MATEGISSSLTKMIIKWSILLFLAETVSCYFYPLFESRQYLRTTPIRRSDYMQLPINHGRNKYLLPDYEDEFMATPQDENEYNAYEKYPYMQYFGYYPRKEYYHDKNSRKNFDGYDYFDSRMPQDVTDEISSSQSSSYPYGQEKWYDEEIPRYDSNAEANAAFLENLIMAQLYQDTKNQRPYGMDFTAADDYDDQHWFYGVPTTAVEEGEKVKQYFKNKEDEEVRQLESLTRKINKNKKIKEKNPFKKQKVSEVIRKPTKPKSRMNDDKYFDMQKQIIVNSRKNTFSPLNRGLRLSTKQSYNPIDVKGNFRDFRDTKVWPSYLEAATNSKKKLIAIKNTKTAGDVEVSDNQIKVETSTAPVSSTAAPRRPHVVGQKEVVLPRPSNPVRRPFDVSSKSQREHSVYDTIKKLLNMEKDFQKSEISQPQKRFVLNEDQLTAELSGLKKLAA